MELLTFLVEHYCTSALLLYVCVCSQWSTKCQSSCQSLQQNAQQDDVNDTLVKMQSTGDNCAELKGQSCHSAGEQEAGWNSVVERSVGSSQVSLSANRSMKSIYPSWKFSNQSRSCLSLMLFITNHETKSHVKYKIHVCIRVHPL